MIKPQLQGVQNGDEEQKPYLMPYQIPEKPMAARRAKRAWGVDDGHDQGVRLRNLLETQNTTSACSTLRPDRTREQCERGEPTLDTPLRDVY